MLVNIRFKGVFLDMEGGEPRREEFFAWLKVGVVVCVED